MSIAFTSEFRRVRSLCASTPVTTRKTSTLSTLTLVRYSRRAVSSSVGAPAVMGQVYSPRIGATNRRLTKSNTAPGQHSRATLTRSGGEASSIVRWSAPTSGATVIPSLLSRHEDRFHGLALPNRLESLGGLLERIFR